MTSSARRPCRVLVAFDKFKGSLSADRACDVVAAVIRRERPRWQVDLAPASDGGDGFCRIVSRAAGGVLHDVHASGPLFDREGGAAPVEALIGAVELAALPPRARELLALPSTAQRIAVLEMAAVNGLALVPSERRDVWRSSSQGTGELLVQAAALGVDGILLGVGGSATSDLGLGALRALGLRFETLSGAELAPPVPAVWPRLQRISGGVLKRLPPLRIACDVDNPVFGPRGAASVYGPQKGLASADIARFDAEAARVAALLCSHVGRGSEHLHTPGAGAAGGIAFGLLVAAQALLVPGSELVLAWLELEHRLEQADWVLTGEGRFDASSLAGKGPGAVLDSARRLGRACVVFAGSVADDVRLELGASGVELVAISDPAQPLEQALAHTERDLARSVEAWLARRRDEDPEALSR